MLKQLIFYIDSYIVLTPFISLVFIHGWKFLIFIKKAHFMVDKIFYW
jgi:hypothetical protein